MDLKSLLQGLPPTIQYVAVIGLVMLILYVCLVLTRLFGQNRGKKEYYDDPEAYEKIVPDLFGSDALKRKSRQKAEPGKDSKGSEADEAGEKESD